MIYSKKRYVCSRYYSNHMKVRSIMRLIKSENIRFILKLPSSDCILSKYETWSGFKQLNKINLVILGLHWNLVFEHSVTIHHPCGMLVAAMLPLLFQFKRVAMFVFTCLLSIFNFPCRGSPFNVRSASLTRLQLTIRAEISNPACQSRPARQTARHKVFQSLLLRP